MTAANQQDLGKSAAPQGESDLLAALARREPVCEVVNKPSSAHETAEQIRKMIASGWEHYLSCDRFLYFRRVDNPSGDDEEDEEDPEDDGKLKCEGCSGFTPESDIAGICQVDGGYRQTGLPCDFGFGHADEWKKKRQGAQ